MPPLSLSLLASVISLKQAHRGNWFACVYVCQRASMKGGVWDVWVSVCVHAYWGVNPGLRARCWWQSRSRCRRASKTAEEETRWGFENTDRQTDKRRRTEEERDTAAHVITSPPLTFTVWHLMAENIWRWQRKIAPSPPAISSFSSPKRITRTTQIEYYSTSYHPFSQIPSFPVWSPPSFVYVSFLHEVHFVHFCSMLAAVCPLASGLATNFIWTGECVRPGGKRHWRVWTSTRIYAHTNTHRYSGLSEHAEPIWCHFRVCYCPFEVEYCATKSSGIQELH